MAQKFDIDADHIRQLATILDETDLTEIEYEAGSVRIRVARQGQPVSVAAPLPAPASQAPPQGESAQPAASAVSWAQHSGAVKSPMVGNAYLSPEPGAPTFVKEGDQIKEGQTLMIIEAMKVMNPLKAPRAGTLIKVLINDSAPVEFDEVLMIIE